MQLERLFQRPIARRGEFEQYDPIRLVALRVWEEVEIVDDMLGWLCLAWKLSAPKADFWCVKRGAAWECSSRATQRAGSNRLVWLHMSAVPMSAAWLMTFDYFWQPH